MRKDNAPAFLVLDPSGRMGSRPRRPRAVAAIARPCAVCFLDLRQSAAITPSGEPVDPASYRVEQTPGGAWRVLGPGGQLGEVQATREGAAALVPQRVPVRARTVAEDGAWLKWELNWAMTWQDADGRYLLRENPARASLCPRTGTRAARWRPLTATTRSAA